MKLSRLIAAFLLGVLAAGHISCHCDQQIIDQHQQALDDEDE